MRRRRRGESGQVAGMEGVVFGVFVFAIGILVIANAWAVVDAKLAASAAAREATRAFVESDGTGAEDAAGDAARLTIEAHGRDWRRTTLEIDAATWARCAPVAITVVYRGSLASVPLLSTVTDGFTVRATHREVIDPYRSGLPGEATC